MVVGTRGQWASYKLVHYVFRYLCKVDYATNKFIHAPAFNYNEAMCLLELVGVAEQT